MNQPTAYPAGPNHLFHYTSDFISFGSILGMLRRQAVPLLVAGGLGLFAGIVYLQTTPPTYVSLARVLIDDGIAKSVDEVSPLAATLQTDATIMSQTEILRSERLARAVVIKEKLDEDPDFTNPPASLLAKTIGAVRGVVRGVLSVFSFGGGAQIRTDTAAMHEARINLASNILQANVIVERSGRSNVIVVGYSSYDPALAQRITQAYADAFLADQLEANFDATERATVWLQERLATLRKDSQEAALAAEDYRAKQGLSVARGELMSEQRLSDLNAQLIVAQSEAAGALARAEQLRKIVEMGPDRAAENLAMSSAPDQGPALTEMRTKYLNLSRREREATELYGAQNTQAVAMRAELSELAKSIFDEAKQLAQASQNEYEVKHASEQKLRSSVESASGQNTDAQRSQVQLRELQQRSEALTNLYQTFLARYEQITQQQSFPIAKARIISEAMLPLRPSSPRTMVVLLATLMLGLMVGGAIAALNEFNERFFRTAADVRSAIGAKFLGYLPSISVEPSKSRRKGLRDLWKEWFAKAQEWKTIAIERVKIRLGLQAVTDAPSGRAPMRRPLFNEPISQRELMSIAIDHPYSIYAETLRSVRLASDVLLQETPCRVIGVVSALPGEGKSTVSSNLAAMLANSGLKTLLIDADLRNRKLTRMRRRSKGVGLVEAVIKGMSWREVANLDKRARVVFVPTLLNRRMPHTGELLASVGMRRFLDSAKDTFDYIIVDLPPLGPVIDAKAFAPFADAFLLVVEWGSTPRELVRSILESEPAISSKMLGVVLNKAEIKSLPKFGTTGSGEQFFERYAEYYVKSPENV
ncbi:MULTISPECIES: polysaccharide biosynthesis tyrosine autokinase [Mesorhizobium]|uniref:non-specific protein-tyrosine kinase n=1 Tax=Mesorhizobium denitrificans TaxID=2294114 RepID=A0A371X949_9HYPH|nr:MULTISPECIES: polysaccharide biosynthesis tyrosine autokinase [Mesorhizobium]RFC65756.1 chain-length determining protein [Mesorhizobium denitrificans]